jgi:hypothetical protein
VTGPESRTLEWAAEVLSDHTGRDITYVDETIDEAYESRGPLGAADWEVEAWVNSYLAVADGDMDVVTDVVPGLTGRAAQGLPEYLEDHPECWAHLVV